MLIGILSVVIIFGCSSNQPVINSEEGFTDETSAQDQAEIDELFNIINQNETAPDEKSGEDEVLQLLGIKKDQKEQGTVEDQSQSEDQLKKEIEMLEQKLADKEAEIEELRSSVEAKDQEIGKLEAGITKPTEAGATGLTGNYREDYQMALEEYYNRNYKQAIQMFEELLARDSSNSLSDNCRYWIGECYYGLGNYNQAIIEFTKVFSFTKSNKMDDAQLKLGLCYWRLGDRDRAVQEFERLVNEYPDSEYVEKAREFLSKLE